MSVDLSLVDLNLFHPVVALRALLTMLNTSLVQWLARFEQKLFKLLLG